MNKIFISLIFMIFYTSCSSKQEKDSESLGSDAEVSKIEGETGSDSDQESNYTEFLENALTAAQRKNEEDFVKNIKYFSVAIERDKITPETLSGKDRSLYTKSLYQALINEVKIPDTYAKQAVNFLNYKMDENPENIFCLGRLYDYGWGVEKNYQKAMELYKKAAEKGHARAMYNIGNMYQMGDGVQKDYTQAKYWYEKGAAKGDDASFQGMGSLYQNGWGVTKDLDKAADWYIKAADKGNKIAIKNMRYVNSDEIFDWLKKNESKQNKDIYFNLANIYHNKKDVSLAHQYYQKSANMGHPEAQYMVAWNYDEGFGGVEINWKEAVKWYQKAAAQNNYNAMYELGTFYYFGVGGMNQNLPKAIDLFKKAKEGKAVNSETALEVMEAIRTGSYFTHENSEFGNRIYLQESDMQIFYKKMPITITEFGAEWTIPVHFHNNAGNVLRIWPSQFKQDRPGDYVYFSNYSPSPAFSEVDGIHQLSISHKKDWGRRNIGYTYISGKFANEELIIKVPTAVCWLPKNEY